MIIAVLVWSFDYHKIDERNIISLSTLFLCNLHALQTSSGRVWRSEGS